ncbi:hypothetical protein M406DRAFT_348565 [Cryphonectria parasitica EP155]|uniref:DUF4048 domain-containing protein n=1 Tax=Cryphonectria parasitica (strain ATCC 38755 / EP155) TaxID=660469 RepID=A0A9P5CJV4_CRYP1|nr:uncharacterized protein M406DRAFT_348565 [Cryphonectria parasitica EP155]KAF3760311.1 hypothetical protein M406DRAFT_348565 [Cryphonectria parasitica EP155]
MPPPPPPPAEELFDSPPSSFGARSTRSLSTTSRNSNRLSLTLPIALPTNAPSRPTPISTTVPSFPPTPGDTPTVRSPTDANDFIHAIAAQERRVLELREDLKSAEAELSRLKKQWGAFDSVRKRNAMVNGEPLRPSPQSSPAVDDVEGKTRSVELDRRRTMLMSQQLSKEATTPTSGRRRVMRGGHTRALSLLSPTKPDEGFSLLDDALVRHKPAVKDSEPHLQNVGRRHHHHHQHPPLAANGISKRATWTPRSSANSPSPGVKQMAEDFKAGLWTFVEDLRQVAVGDEPITGTPSGGGYRRVSGRQNESDRDTIRASSSSSRPHVGSIFSSNDHTPTPSTRFCDPLSESDTANLGRPKRTNSKRAKHFSWTPLTVDAFDDADWSNWESPPAAPSPRWSGTTVNGDIITTAIPEGKGDENDSLKDKTSTPCHREPPESPPLSAVKIEEMLKQLSPGNLKRATSDFMKEWEKSLGEPAIPIKDKAC